MKKQNLILIGLSGSGKSTLGHALATHLGWEFVDTDHTIEELSQTTIPELFLQGEPYFRNWEFEAISSLENLTNTIISTGGGVVTEPRTMARLAEMGTIIHIERSIEEILQTDDLTGRPLLAGNAEEKLRQLEEKRRSLYEKYREHRIHNSGEINQILLELEQLVDKIQAQ